MKHFILNTLILSVAIFTTNIYAEARFVHTPYKDIKVVYDFYFDQPEKIGPALYWLRSTMKTLMDEPYGMAPEFMNIVVVIHGAEIVTLVKKNEARYQDAVDRMRYYADFGVKFKVCALAAADYDYELKDFQDFVEMVPSAMAELVHWQMQGYGLLTPKVMTRNYTVDEIR